MSGYGVCSSLPGGRQGCGREIVWAITTPGRKRMPLDPERYAEAHELANVAVHRDHLGSIIARVLRKGEEPDGALLEWRAMPHFATCPVLLRDRDAKREAAPELDARPDNVVPFRRRPGGVRR